MIKIALNIIILGMIGGFVALIIIINRDGYFTALGIRHSNSAIVSNNYALTTNNVIQGEIRAKENFLGAVSMDFYSSEAVVDRVIFRIREKGSQDWYYTNEYTTEQIFLNHQFPFGFQPIPDSYDKHYEFELESQGLDKTNTLSINKDNPNVITIYQIPKNIIFSDLNQGIHFLYSKLYSYFSSKFSFIVILLCQTPTFVYILYIISKLRSPIKNSSQVYNLLEEPIWIPFVVLLTLNIYYFSEHILLSTTLTLLLWFRMFIVFRRQIKFFYAASMILFIIAQFYIFIREYQTAEVLALWGFQLLFFGSLNNFILDNKYITKLLTLKISK